MLKALVLNCSLKSSAKVSSTEKLSKVVCDELEKYDVKTEMIRIADYNVLPGVATNEGEGDEWPVIHDKILNSEILIIASPTWVGAMSSFAMRIIERMDAMLSETGPDNLPVAYNHVAGFVAVGNEDGAKHVIGEISACLLELGFTVPGQAFTYFNNGSAMGKDYVDTDNKKGAERAEKNASLAARNLVGLAKALQAQPITTKRSR